MNRNHFAPYGKAPVHYPCDGGIAPDAELLIVEGDSAAKSVNQVRDTTNQSVLALQGKPMNAAKASTSIARRNEIFQRIAATLLDRSLAPGEDWILAVRDASACRYRDLVLLMDPDADGIHCGVLMMAFLQRFVPGVIGEGRVSVVRPPMFLYRFGSSDADRCLVASNPDHARRIEDKLAEAGVHDFERFRHRGLGSIPPELLRTTSVDRKSRAADVLSVDDVVAAVKLFGG